MYLAMYIFSRTAVDGSSIGLLLWLDDFAGLFNLPFPFLSDRVESEGVADNG